MNVINRYVQTATSHGMKVKSAAMIGVMSSSSGMLLAVLQVEKLIGVPSALLLLRKIRAALT